MMALTPTRPEGLLSTRLSLGSVARPGRYEESLGYIAFSRIPQRYYLVIGLAD